ncbi:hypothetical protein ACFLQ5_04145, partial [Bacteroidota bacterium]
TSSPTATLIYLDGINTVGSQKLRIFNNFLSNTGFSNDVLSGIHIISGYHIDIAYNSVNILNGSTSALSGGIVIENGSNIDLKNNIVYNQNPSYAINLTSTSIGFTSDYNNFYTTGSNLGNFGGPKTTLSQWTQATQKDSNSISVQPYFFSSSDLHLTTNNCAIDNKGIQVVGISDDIDGDLRSSTKPTIGADEIILNLPSGPVAPNHSICYGDTVPLLTATGESGAQFYWYSDSLLTILLDSGSTYNTGKTLPGIYIYYVIQVNQCPSPATKVILTIQALPNVSLGLFSNQCLDATPITLTTGLPIGGIYSGTAVSGNIFNPDTAGVGTHLIIYTFTDTSGCTNSDTSSITVNSVPLSIITANGPTTFCPGYSLTLQGNTGSGLSYQWLHNGISISSATNSSLVVTLSGSYTLEVTNSLNCTKLSSPVLVSVDSLATPSICIVTVDSAQNKNMVVWEKNYTLNVDSFKIHKETTQANVYQLIGTTSYSASAKFVDQSSIPNQIAARYKISAIDTCGNQTALSNHHKTIHLTINAGTGLSWNLIWSHYEGFSFLSYNIYRGTSATNMSWLTQIQSNLNSYTDFSPPAGNVYYQIEVVKATGCYPDSVYSKANTNYNSSRSNIANSFFVPQSNNFSMSSNDACR